jgi:hypothetical protein
MRNIPREGLPKKGIEIDVGVKVPMGQIGILCNDGFCSDLAGSILEALSGSGVTADLSVAIIGSEPGINVRPDNPTTRAIATAIETATNGRILVGVVDEIQDKNYPQIIISIGVKSS